MRNGRMPFLFYCFFTKKLFFLIVFLVILKYFSGCYFQVIKNS